MLSTRTGSFPIGFRRGWSDWQKDLPGLIAWAKENGMGVIDLGGNPDDVATVKNAGLSIGSVDLGGWSGLISDDAAKRADGLAKNEELFKACAPQGVTNYFAVMLPEKPERPRSENFSLMVDGLNQLASLLEKYNGRLVIEGWPGPGALCCTPESCRATFAEVASPSIGLNYDPSHLLRMGIDPIRFAEEFASRVYHAHGKDTEIIDEALYEFGTEQPATLAKGHGFGSNHWRYTIPGHGQVRWVRALEILASAGYKGAICVELEDENFNGSEAGEKLGLVTGGNFLAGC